jgi:hypothetical protein
MESAFNGCGYDSGLARVTVWAHRIPRAHVGIGNPAAHLDQAVETATRLSPQQKVNL